MDGETRVVADTSQTAVIGRGRALTVPIGEHGVLSVGIGEEETYDENSQKLVELVAATAESAFDRVESQANLRDRDELLQAQNQRLQRVNQMNRIIRNVDQGLVQATSREEIERVVCERLIRSDRFRFGWIGAPTDMDDGLTPRAWSGEGRGYIDSIDLSAPSESDEPDPALRASKTGEVTVISNIAENLRSGRWRKEAFSREFQSVIAIPLRYEDVGYGVLSVYADRPNVFEEMEQTVFVELGETIANAIAAVETKQSLLGEKIVELDFRLRDESRSFLARVARQLGCTITFEGIIPLTESKSRMFFVARDVPAEAVTDALDRSVVVESQNLLASSERGHLVEVVVASPSIPSVLFEQGASLRTLTVTDDQVELTVELPTGADVRGFIEKFQNRYESARFVARRKRERPARTADGVLARLGDVLTDRQLEVLKTAYFSGFFETPRRSTGGDIAELLDVSQPTISEQLRTAQGKVLDLLFGDELVGDEVE